MPIYEYKCEGCGEVFERIEKFSDEPLTVHEKCGGPVHRLISSSAFQLKGSGWYATDYAKGNGGSKKNESDKSEKKDSSDSASKTETKSTESKSTESKPASSDKPKSD